MTDTTSPFDDPRGRQSEELAVRAEQAWSARKPAEARQLFAKAADLEEQVAREVPPALVRVRGVLAISAVALWYKAGEYARAKRLAYVFLAAEPPLSDQGRIDLEELVDRCSREAELGRIANDPAMVAVEVKLDGGRVGKGVAPAAATRRCRDSVTALLMRSAELEAGYPYRERGESGLERTDALQIYEVPARAASFGLRFYIATGTQQDSLAVVTPEKAVQRFLSLAGAAEAGPDAVRAAVGDEQYAQAFIDGFGEIAPDGDEVGSVVCSASSWKVPRSPRVAFELKHRTALRSSGPAGAARRTKPGEKMVEGTLECVHLSSSEKWVKVRARPGDEPDVIMIGDKDRKLQAKAAPLVDMSVRVFGQWNAKARRISMTDIVVLSRGRLVEPIE